MDACYRMRDRFLGEEVWEPARSARTRWASTSPTARPSASSAASCSCASCPVLKDIGLWGPQHREGVHRHGRAGLRRRGLDAEMAGDEAAAEDFDEERLSHIRAVADTAG